MLNKVFQIFAFTIVAISTFGCNDSKMVLDMASNIVNEQSEPQSQDDFSMQDIPVCKTGDVLMVGQKCVDEGTDATFTILDNGLASYTSKSGLLYQSTDVLDATGTSLNDQTYNFIARKLSDGTWKIVTVSSDEVRDGNP